MAGSITADIGLIIPAGKSFTDRVHYVRSGDFVTALVAKAQADPYRKDPRFLAFALGFLSHYPADRYGHYSGTNVLVALIKQAAIQRVTYERDMDKHMWVETQLGLLDVIDTPEIVTAGFIDAIARMRNEPDKFLYEAYQLLVAVIMETYPATRVAFSAYEFYRYLRFAAGALCMTSDVASTLFARPPSGAALGFVSFRQLPSMESPCTDIFKGARSRPEDDQALNKLLDALKKPLRLPEGMVRRIQHQSFDRVRENLTAFVEGRLQGRQLPNFNLDTNLSSKGGQYQCADSAFQELMQGTQPLRGPSPSAERAKAVKELDDVFDKYEKDGAEAYNAYSQPLGGIDPATLPFHADLEDIAPPTIGKFRVPFYPAKQCAVGSTVRFGVGNETFLFDTSSRIFCTPKPPRAIEELYAYRIAQVIQDFTSPPDSRALQGIVERVLPNYLEAVERLRLGPSENKDAKTRLYRAGSCGVASQAAPPAKP
jgi:hypothetical protein